MPTIEELQTQIEQLREKVSNLKYFVSNLVSKLNTSQIKGTLAFEELPYDDFEELSTEDTIEEADKEILPEDKLKKGFL